MLTDRFPSKLTPLTVNVTFLIRDGLQRIAAREVLSLSDVARRAFLAEIERRDSDEEQDHGR